jgi:hypothetical protein
VSHKAKGDDEEEETCAYIRHGSSSSQQTRRSREPISHQPKPTVERVSSRLGASEAMTHVRVRATEHAYFFEAIHDELVPLAHLFHLGSERSKNLQPFLDKGRVMGRKKTGSL